MPRYLSVSYTELSGIRVELINPPEAQCVSTVTGHAAHVKGL